MPCLEIILPIIIAVTAVAGAVTAVSETLPFIKKISGNGILHTMWHLAYPEKCIEPSDSSDSIISLE